MVRRALLMLLCALCGAGQAHAASGSLTAAVDRKELYQNEHVVLTLTLADSDTRLRAEGVAPNVDLTRLTDQFELGTPRTDFRFSLAREQRRASSELTVELFPKRSGRLTIPAFEVDGLRTAPIALKVLPLPEDARPEVFARSDVVRRALYVGEQTLLYLDLYYRTELKRAEFGAALATEPLQIEVHALPAAERSERVDGLEYNVTRSAWAVSPQSDAPVTLFLPSLWIETRAGQQWRLPPQQQRLEVRARPAGLPPGALPARPQLSAGALAAATVGRIAPWQVTVRAAVGLNTLPEHLPFTPVPAGLKLYFDPPERRLELNASGGVDSVAVYSGYLLPLAAGTLATPALDLPYFDMERGGVARATLPAQTLEVADAPPPAAEPAAPGPASAAPAPVRTATRAADTTALTAWQAAAGVLLLAWLTTLVLWWRRSAPRRRRRTTAPATAAPPGHALKEQLLAALGGARTLEQGLREREARHGVDEELRAAVRAVQRLCYRPGVPTDEPATQAVVGRAIAGIRRRDPPVDAAVDPWAPQAFRPAASVDTSGADR